LVVVTMVGTTAALAYGPTFTYASRYNEVKHLRMYDRNYLLRPDEQAHLVPMPIPANTGGVPTMAEMQGARAEQGANLPGLDDVTRLSAGVLPGKSGLGMLTPRERTQNEVRRLARSLD
jgi:hypothetical protein